MVKGIGRDELLAELRFSLTRMRNRRLHTPAAERGAATCFHFGVVFPHFIAPAHTAGLPRACMQTSGGCSSQFPKPASSGLRSHFLDTNN